jgi:phosphoserine aminotransferase
MRIRSYAGPMKTPLHLPYGRVFNFSSGPAVLPVEVLEQIRDEMLNWKGSGVSVLEMSHRSKPFDQILAHATQGIREVLGVPETHEVLFLQGGATLQFSMIPLNLAHSHSGGVDLIHTGTWTELAIQEASKVTQVHVVASGQDSKFAALPDFTEAQYHSGVAYRYLCSNNTIEGTQFKQFPAEQGGVPWVVDMSSDIFSKPIDVSNFGLIFAGAQKNIGPSGVTLVIIRKDLLDRAPRTLGKLLQYRVHAEGGSRANTPPTFGIYVCGLVMDWLKRQGGLTAMAERNAAKAKLLYDAIDKQSSYYYGPVNEKDRSDMNVVFRIRHADPEKAKALEEKFARDAEKAGLIDVKGHRSVGGLRASLYNAFPREGVEALTQFMTEFAAQNPNS